MLPNFWASLKSTLEIFNFFYLPHIGLAIGWLGFAAWLSVGLHYGDLFRALIILLLLVFMLWEGLRCCWHWARPPGIPKSGWSLDEDLPSKVTSGSDIERWDALCELLREDLSKKLKNAQVPAELSWREELLFKHVAKELRGVVEDDKISTDADRTLLLHLLTLRPWSDGQVRQLLRQRKIWDALRHLLLLTLERDPIPDLAENDPLLTLLRESSPPTGVVNCDKANADFLKRVAPRLLTKRDVENEDLPRVEYSIQGTAWQKVSPTNPAGIHLWLDKRWEFWHRCALYSLTPTLAWKRLPQTKWYHQPWCDVGLGLLPWLILTSLLSVWALAPSLGTMAYQEVRPEAFECGLEPSLTASSTFGLSVGKLLASNGNSRVPLVLVKGHSLGWDCFFPPWSHRIEHTDAQLLPLVSDLEKVPERWPAEAPSLTEWLKKQRPSAGVVVGPEALELQFVGLVDANSASPAADAGTQDYLTAQRLSVETLPGNLPDCQAEKDIKNPFWICTLPPLQRDAIRQLLTLNQVNHSNNAFATSLQKDLNGLLAQTRASAYKGQYDALAVLLQGPTQSQAVIDLTVLKTLSTAPSIFAWPNSEFCTSGLLPKTVGLLGHSARCIGAWGEALLQVTPRSQPPSTSAVDAKAWKQLVAQVFAAVKSWRKTSYDKCLFLSLTDGSSKVLLNAELNQPFTPFTLRRLARGLARARVHLVGSSGNSAGNTAVADLKALEDSLLIDYLPTGSLRNLTLTSAELHLRRELAVLLLGQAMFEWLTHPNATLRLVPTFKEGQVLYEHTPRARTLRIEAAGLAMAMLSWYALNAPRAFPGIPHAQPWWNELLAAQLPSDPFVEGILRRAITEPHVVLTRYGMTDFP